MTLGNFIEGLKTLRPYYVSDGYHIGAEHDQFYLYATKERLSEADIVKMRRLGWFQPEVESSYDGDKEKASDAQLIAEYDPEDGWSCFT